MQMRAFTKESDMITSADKEGLVREIVILLLLVVRKIAIKLCEEITG